MLEQLFGVGSFEIIGAELLFVLQEHVAIGHAGIIVGQIVNALDALDIHSEPFQPVGQLTGDRRAIMAGNLLEIGELAHFHAVAPYFPTQTPGAQCGAFPVILHKAHIMFGTVDADGIKTADIEADEVRGAGLQDHLELVIMLQAVRVFAVTTIGRPPARLHITGVPVIGPKAAKRGGGVEGAGPHFQIERLQDYTPLIAPILLEREDHRLEG